MDIRVIGGGAAAVVFGMGGLTYIDVADVIGDIEPVAAIAPAERQAYMDGVVSELNDAYEHVFFEQESYVFVGDVSFKGDASKLAFSELIRSEETLSPADRAQVAKDWKQSDYCEAPDTTIFTAQGWDYVVTLRDGSGHLIVTERCRAQVSGPELRGLAS